MNNFAVSSDGLATALQTSASALMSAGNDLNQSVALVAAANKVLQDPSQAGAALRTIALRIRGTSLEVLQEMGEETDGVIESVSKLQEKVKAISGVDILDDSGAYRDTYDILVDLAEVWEEIGQKDPKGQAALLELLAGKNRSNALAAILTNLEDLEGAYDAALQSEGSAQKELDTYLNSIQGRIDQFNNSVQTMWMNAINSDTIKGFVDAGTFLINILDGLNQRITVFGTLGVAVASFIGLWKGVPALWTAVSAASKTKIATLMGETAVIEGLNAVQAKKAILDSKAISNDTAKAAASAIFTGAEGKETIATNLNTVAAIKNALATKGVVGADAEAVIAAMGLTTANTGVATSFGVATKAANAFLLALLKNPITWVVVGIAAVVSAIDLATTSFSEAKAKLKETSDELETTRSTIESLNDELETTKDRIDEINAKESPTIAEQEELDKLIAQNDELERQLRLEEQREKLLAKQQAKDLHDTLARDGSMKTYEYSDPSGGTTVVDTVAGELAKTYAIRQETIEHATRALEEAQRKYDNALTNGEETYANDLVEWLGWDSEEKKAVDEARANLERVKEMFSDTESDILSELDRLKQTYGSVEWQTGDNLEQWQKDLNEDLELVYEAIYKLSMITDETGKIAEDAFNWVADRSDVSGFVDKVKEIENLDTTNITGVEGFDSFLDELIQVGFIADKTPASIQKVVDAFNSLGESAGKVEPPVSEVENSLNTTLDALSKFESGMGDLSDVYNEFIENGSATATSLAGLAEAFNTGNTVDEYEDLVRVLGDSTSTAEEAQTAIENLASAYLNSLDLTSDVVDEDVALIISSLEKLGIVNAEQLVNSKIAAYEAVLEIYGVDLKNYASLEEGKGAILTSMLADRFSMSADEINKLAEQYNIDLTNFAGTEAEKVKAAKDAARQIAEAHKTERLSSLDAQLNERMVGVDTTTVEGIEEEGLLARWYLSERDKILSEYETMSKDIEDIKEIDPNNYVPTWYSASKEIDFDKFSNIGSNSSSKAEKDTTSELDWIDHYFDAIDNRIKANEAKLEDTLADVANIAKRNDIINTIIEDYKKKIPQIEDVIDEYSTRAQQLYNSFSPDIQQKINSGSLDISEYDDKLAEQIQDYFSYVEQKSDWEIELANLNVTIDDYELQKFNNVADAYDNELSLEEDFNNKTQAQIDLLEEQGERVSKELYDAMISGTVTQLETLGAKRTALQNQLKAAMDRGVEEGSEQWYAMVTAINDVDAAISDAETSIESYKNSIEDLYLKDFEDIAEKYDNELSLDEYANSKIQAQIDLLEEQGEKVTADLYEAMISGANDQIATLTNKYIDLQEQLNIAMANGIEEGSDAWYQMVTAINDVDEAITQAKINVESFKNSIKDLYLKDFEDIAEKYDNELSLEKAFNNKIQAQINLLEEQGEQVSEELYQAMIRGTSTQLDMLRNKRADLQNQLNVAIANGIDSDAWYKMVTEINDVDAAIIEAETDIESFNNSIQDLHWEKFDTLVDRISAVSDEAENLRSLLDTDKVLKNNFSDGYLDGLTELDKKLKDGKISVTEYTKKYDQLAKTFKDAYGWTDDGATALGLLSQEMENAKYLADLYDGEIQNLTANYEELGYSESEYQKKLKELKDGQWDAIKTYESAKDSILDLNKARVEEIKDGIQKQIDAYEELIDKQKESLQQERKQREMAKEDKEYDDEVAAIQRKLRAMQNDNSASSLAQQKLLKAELSKLEEERLETEYDREMDSKEQALDDSLDLYTEGKEALMSAWDEYLTDEERVMDDSYTNITRNVENINKTIRDLSVKYGVEISDAVNDPWEEAQLTLDEYSSQFETATGVYLEKLSDIKSSLEILEEQANATALALLAMLEAQAKEIAQSKITAEMNAANNDKQPTDNKDQDGSNNPHATNNNQQTGGNKTQIDKDVGDTKNDDGAKPSGGDTKPVGNSSAGAANIQDKTPTKGATVVVDSDATHFSSKSNNAHMASFVPGGTYTVMQTSGDQVLIGKGGVVTGWVDKSDLNGYAKGTTGVKNDELAWIDENGLEEIVMHAQNGRLAYLTKGSSVIPHDISENLMELGKVDPKTWIDNNRPTSVPANFVSQNNNVDLKFGSMINIEHADKDSIPEIKDAVQKQLDSYMKTINNGIKRYSR